MKFIYQTKHQERVATQYTATLKNVQLLKSDEKFLLGNGCIKIYVQVSVPSLWWKRMVRFELIITIYTRLINWYLNLTLIG